MIAAIATIEWANLACRALRVAAGAILRASVRALSVVAEAVPAHERALPWTTVARVALVAFIVAAEVPALGRAVVLVVRVAAPVPARVAALDGASLEILDITARIAASDRAARRTAAAAAAASHRGKRHEQGRHETECPHVPDR